MQCPSCAGALAYIPGRGAFECSSCGNASPFPSANLSAVESSKLLDLLQAPAPSKPARVHQCRNCGASTEIPSGSLVACCPFCGSTLGEGFSDHDHLEPNHLIPFALDREAALERIALWNDQRTRVEEMTDNLPKFGRAELRHAVVEPVFLPFWVFSPMKGRDIEHTLEIVSSTGFGRQARVPERIPHYLGASFPGQELHALEPWPLTESVPYHPVFLRGIAVESPGSDLAEAWRSLEANVAFPDLYLDHLGGRIDLKSLMAMPEALRMVRHGVRRIPLWGEILRPEDLRARLVLLPAWICNATLEGKRHRLFVNGTTGEVAFDMAAFGGVQDATRQAGSQLATIASGCALPTAGFVVGIAAFALTRNPWFAIVPPLVAFLASPFVIWKGWRQGRKVRVSTGPSSAETGLDKRAPRAAEVGSSMTTGCVIMAMAPIGMIGGSLLGLALGLGNEAILVGAAGFLVGPIVGGVLVTKFFGGGARRK